jgi:hypothetical protein
MKVSVYCSDCLARVGLEDPAVTGEGEVRCVPGHASISFAHSESVRAGERVDRCSRCGKTAFFVQKDFDQRLGCAILVGGAVLALVFSYRFGGVVFVPTLLVFAAIDFVLARRVAPVVICYACDTEYRDVPSSESHRPYDPHIAERYAEVKTVRRMNE